MVTSPFSCSLLYYLYNKKSINIILLII